MHARAVRLPTSQAAPQLAMSSGRGGSEVKGRPEVHYSVPSFSLGRRPLLSAALRDMTQRSNEGLAPFGHKATQFNNGEGGVGIRYFGKLHHERGR